MTIWSDMILKCYMKTTKYGMPEDTYVQSGECLVQGSGLYHLKKSNDITTLVPH